MLKLAGRWLLSRCGSLARAEPDLHRACVAPSLLHRSMSDLSAGADETQKIETTRVRGIHVIQCEDQPGIVARIAQCVASHGGSVESMDIHIDVRPAAEAAPSSPPAPVRPTFYARSVFSLPSPASASLSLALSSLASAVSARTARLVLPGRQPCLRAGLLVSKQDHCLMDLLYRWQEGSLPIDIACVISNHDRSPDTHLRRVLARHGIPFHFVPLGPEAPPAAEPQDSSAAEPSAASESAQAAAASVALEPEGPGSREGSGSTAEDGGKLPVAEGYAGSAASGESAARRRSERAIMQLVGGGQTDFLVLARYMQILSSEFLKDYGRDIINIHHGLLPHFKGANPYRQAYNAGVKLIGATSHFVTEHLDDGPIIEQLVDRVTHRDTLMTVAAKSRVLEKHCLGAAVQYFSEYKVLRDGHGKTIVFS